MMDSWLEFLRREAGVVSGSRMQGCTLVCTSYNKEKHAIKGILQPHGVETGWIPIGIIGAGPNFGIAIGPKAGDPKKLDGDQFEISFVNGDPNSPVARHRLSSDQDKPPQVETGEIAIVSQFNHSIHMTKDGAITINTTQKDVAGKNDNSGPNITVNSTAGNIAVNATKANQKGGKITHTASDGDKKIHTTTMDPDAGTLTHKSTDGTNTHSVVLDIVKGITHTSSVNVAIAAPSTNIVAKNVSVQGFMKVLSNSDGTGGVLTAARGLGAPITNAILGTVPTS